MQASFKLLDLYNNQHYAHDEYRHTCTDECYIILNGATGTLLVNSKVVSVHHSQKCCNDFKKATGKIVSMGKFFAEKEELDEILKNTNTQCECGATKCGSPMHSDWCPRKEFEND